MALADLLVVVAVLHADVAAAAAAPATDAGLQAARTRVVRRGSVSAMNVAGSLTHVARVADGHRPRQGHLDRLRREALRCSPLTT